VHVVSEALLGDRRTLPQRDRIGQAPRNAADVGGGVSVAAIRVAECQLVADAVQATRDLTGEGEVTVRVTSRDAALDAAAAAVADLAEAERAICDSPADPRRCPRPGLEPLVAVEGRRPQQAELLRGGNQAGDVVLERFAHAVRAIVTVE